MKLFARSTKGDMDESERAIAEFRNLVMKIPGVTGIDIEEIAYIRVVTRGKNLAFCSDARNAIYEAEWEIVQKYPGLICDWQVEDESD